MARGAAGSAFSRGGFFFASTVSATFCVVCRTRKPIWDFVIMTKTLTRRVTERLCICLLAILATVSTMLPSCTTHRDHKGTTMGSSRSLPPPDVNASAVLQVLKKRKTSREFADTALGDGLLSGVLWAAYGINRADGKRTAPSAHDWQYIDVYLTDNVGLYRYNAKPHALELVKMGDIRALTGYQPFAATAPVSLVYVSDERKFPPEISSQDRLLFSAATSGAIAQNVFIFCAANNLNTGVRSDIDRAQLHRAMELAPEQKIVLAQSVGLVPAMASVKARIRSLLGRE
jgi:nitroreductase